MYVHTGIKSRIIFIFPPKKKKMEKLKEKPMIMNDVFEEGDVGVKKGSSPSALLVFSPIIPGKYPVLLFFHGFVLKPIWYKSLLQHISSHRYIIVAPKLSSLISQSDEVKRAAKVTEWLGKGLISVLPEKVQPDLLKLAVSGHSRGGKIAFALALLHGNSTPTPLKFQALVGIDPVAGSSPSCLSAPKILKYIPQSFDQSIPVAVIGFGLGNQRAHCTLVRTDPLAIGVESERTEAIPEHYPNSATLNGINI
ncbi:chlorophyllase type 0-like [Capsicum chacoense]